MASGELESPLTFSKSFSLVFLSLACSPYSNLVQPGNGTSGSVQFHGKS